MYLPGEIIHGPTLIKILFKLHVLSIDEASLIWVLEITVDVLCTFGHFETRL